MTIPQIQRPPETHRAFASYRPCVNPLLKTPKCPQMTGNVRKNQKAHRLRPAAVRDKTVKPALPMGIMGLRDLA